LKEIIMDKTRSVPVALLCFLVFVSYSYAQMESTESSRRKYYHGDTAGFLNRQAEATLDLVSTALNRFPPVIPEPFERRMAFLMIDGILHYEDAPQQPAVQEFFHSRMEKVLDGLAEAHVQQGAVIWKLYNHGFIVRTETVTIAFDLVRGYSTGSEGFPISDALLEKISRYCDVLFISHRHGDHADEAVAKAFIKQGKPVIAPAEVWAEKPIHGKIFHLRRDTLQQQEILVKEGNQRLRVVLFPGHQGKDIPNNVPLVFTPEGISVSQTGDQSNLDDFAWIDKVAKSHKVDILLPNCWTTDILRMIRGFDPQLIITGHENELGHSVDHREPFWMTYDLLQDSDTPYLIMTWGESYHYFKPETP
jgi:hypothetical protein